MKPYKAYIDTIDDYIYDIDFCLAIDCGNKTGTAIINLKNGSLLHRQQVNNQGGVEHISATIDQLLYYAKRLSNKVAVVIEDSFVLRNISTAKKLSFLAGHWSAMAMSFGIENVCFIQPATWQNAVGINKKKEDTKKGAERVVKELYSITDFGEDECDAICIASYVYQLKEVLS